LEKLYDKHDKAQMDMRQTHGQLEKYKEETATLEAEVDRFAGRMGKYQVNRNHKYCNIFQVVWCHKSNIRISEAFIFMSK
jgi:hypothetical protein